MSEPKTPKKPEGYVDIAEDMLGDDPEPAGGWREYDAQGNPIPKKPKPQSLKKAKTARSKLPKK